MPHRTVGRYMTTASLCTCSADISVRDAVRLMSAKDIGCLLGVEGERLIGILSEGDVLKRVVSPGHDAGALRVAEVMTRDPDTIRPNQPVNDAIRMMDEFGYRHLPVIEHGRVCGVLTMKDCELDDLAAMAHELAIRNVFAERAW
jgi:CBS domain-containing protein